MNIKSAIILILIISNNEVAISQNNTSQVDEYYATAVQLVEDQNYEQAIIYLDRAIALDPVDTEFYLYKGYCLENLDNLNNTIKMFEVAVVMNTKSFKEVYQALIKIYISQKSYPDLYLC